MFFALSKLTYWLVMPTSLIIFLFIGAWLVKPDKLKKLFFNIGIAVLLIFTNPIIAKLAMNCWEPNATPYSTMDRNFEYGIVLTGVTNLERAPYDRIQFNKGADRIIQAIELYKWGIINRILITGGTGGLPFNVQNESESLQILAISSGVPPDKISIEPNARNTRENAVFTFEILSGKSSKNVLLITSAFHIPRAMKCFEKAGFTPTAFPTDHYGGGLHLSLNHFLVPTPNALIQWHILFKEWLGIASYWAMGYI